MCRWRPSIHDRKLGDLLQQSGHQTYLPRSHDTMAEPCGGRVRLIKRQVSLTLNSIKAGIAPASLKAITYKQLVKAAATARNLSVTYGGVTPLELAFGRRPAELVQLDTATLPQLTIPNTEEELSAGQIRLLAQQS